MKIGIVAETAKGERRVAGSPEMVGKLINAGHSCYVQTHAGDDAGFDDQVWQEAGAEVVTDTTKCWQLADVLLKVTPPAEEEWKLLRRGQTLISFIYPAQNEKFLHHCAQTGVNVLAMDSIPRISRAQKMDALSAMANVAGYRAVIEAAHSFQRFFAGQITAAGKIPPANVLVIGAGVAGLSAIGTANALGAQVRAFDTRPEVKEQVESMGAHFLTITLEEDGTGIGGYAREMSQEFIQAEKELFAKECKQADIVITTALIPGKAAPKLLDKNTVRTMKKGSVIVDLAAAQGGNCVLTEPGKARTHNGVRIIGYEDLPSRSAHQSSQLYANNILHLLHEMTQDADSATEVLPIDMDDEVIRGATVVKDGEITWPPPPVQVSLQPEVQTPPVPAETPAPTATVSRFSHLAGILPLLCGAIVLYGVGLYAPVSFLQHFTVFILACFVGYMVVWNVTPSLHTPLMSVTNAISSIIIIGALVQVTQPGFFTTLLALLAIFITSINIFGGFAVTRRMLSMFRK